MEEGSECPPGTCSSREVLVEHFSYFEWSLARTWCCGFLTLTWFLFLLPSDFPQERCPVVLAPLLYPEKRDILMDRILPDSGGIAKTMMESSLADFMQEVGYGFCTRFVGKPNFLRGIDHLGWWWFSFSSLRQKVKKKNTLSTKITRSIMRLSAFIPVLCLASSMRSISVEIVYGFVMVRNVS